MNIWTILSDQQKCHTRMKLLVTDEFYYFIILLRKTICVSDEKSVYFVVKSVRQITN
jgi:hypothetical protein